MSSFPLSSGSTSLSTPWWVLSTSNSPTPPTGYPTVSGALWSTPTLTWTGVNCDGYVIEVMQIGTGQGFYVVGRCTTPTFSINLNNAFTSVFRITGYNAGGFSNPITTRTDIVIGVRFIYSSTKIILWAGQSNGQGYATGFSTTIDVAPPGCFQYVIGDGLASDSYSTTLTSGGTATAPNRGQIVPLTGEPLFDAQYIAMSAHPNTSMGAVCAFARAYKAVHPYDNLVFVQTRVNGVALETSTTPNWSPSGTLLPRALTAVASAISQNPYCEFYGINWDQGENDAQAYVSTPSYQAALTNF